MTFENCFYLWPWWPLFFACQIAREWAPEKRRMLTKNVASSAPSGNNFLNTFTVEPNFSFGQACSQTYQGCRGTTHTYTQEWASWGHRGRAFATGNVRNFRWSVWTFRGLANQKKVSPPQFQPILVTIKALQCFSRHLFQSCQKLSRSRSIFWSVNSKLESLVKNLTLLSLIQKMPQQKYGQI